MNRPCNATELRMFIGRINYYRDMWSSRAHILKRSTNLFILKKKAPIKWKDEMQKVFDKMCLQMAANALALQLILTIMKGSTCTLTPLTSSLVHV
jgi:hypothetical protein